MGKTMETVAGFIFLGSKIRANGDCSHEIKRHLLLGRKVMTDLGSILKKKKTLLYQQRSIWSKLWFFPVVMYECESWTIKKAEHWRIDAFELWCWRRLLSPLDSKEIKPVNLKGNQPWVLFGGTEAEAGTPACWSSAANSWLMGDRKSVV